MTHFELVHEPSKNSRKKSCQNFCTETTNFYRNSEKFLKSEIWEKGAKYRRISEKIKSVSLCKKFTEGKVGNFEKYFFKSQIWEKRANYGLPDIIDYLSEENNYYICIEGRYIEKTGSTYLPQHFIILSKISDLLSEGVLPGNLTLLDYNMNGFLSQNIRKEPLNNFCQNSCKARFNKHYSDKTTILEITFGRKTYNDIINSYKQSIYI